MAKPGNRDFFQDKRLNVFSFFYLHIVKEVKLTQGYFALVDDDLFDAINSYKWHIVLAPRNKYAARTIRKDDGKQGLVLMHRQILGLTNTRDQGEHRDGNGLNNQTSNLRVATNAQNQMNRHRTVGKSKFKGVYWQESAKKWHSQIVLNGKVTYLGLYTTDTEAAEAYDKAAALNFGSFAKLNFSPARE